jgi:hypothetical protein
VTLGALNLLFVQAPRPGRTPHAVLALAVLTNSAAWAAGTIVGTTFGPVEWTLVGAGVFVIMLAKRFTLFNQLALITAIMFVISVGLPGGWAAVLPNTGLIALGGAWGLLGAVLPAYVRWVERPLPASAHLSPKELLPVRATVSFSVAVGVAVAVGLAIGQSVALPRDYWVMLTIVAAFRPELAGTFEFAAARVIGTVAGAAAVLFVTLFVSDPWLLALAVVLSASVTYATRAVNYTLYALFLTVFLVLLLDLAYHGGPTLAADRVIDTAIGGLLAVSAGFLLSTARNRIRALSPPPVGATPPHAV